MTKQFLLLCDEAGMEKLKYVSNNTIQFLEVQGLNLNNENKFNILLTPVLPPVTPMPVPSIPPQSEPEASVINDPPVV